MIDEEKTWSVGGFLDHLNNILKSEEVFVVGEVTELKKHPTGFYFALKDQEGEGILFCYLSPRKAKMFGIDFEDGFLVKVGGSPGIYKPRGSFSFVVESLELVGEGSLKKTYELLKKKLETEGLFMRKRELPKFINSVGIITSKTGAVIDDFRKNLKQLGLHLCLYDARVEGREAVANIMAGIDYFNGFPEGTFDVLVVMRGGGSLEDLQAFNNEAVARKVFSSRIPVLCGIGHDKDVPIASLVCDKAVSTPSIAAQTVNASWDDLFSGVPLLSKKLSFAFESALGEAAGTLENLSQPLLGFLFSEIERVKARLEYFLKYLNAANPMRNLKLGYSVVFGNGEKIIKDARLLKKHDKITIKLFKGLIGGKVTDIIDE